MDSLRKVVLTNRILAACLIGTLLWHWGLVRALLYAGPWSILGIVIVVFVRALGRECCRTDSPRFMGVLHDAYARALPRYFPLRWD